MRQVEWFGLYADSWQGEIVPEAFSHPAKYSRALIRKIYQHMLDRGWIKAGDKVIDPFGGVALGAYHAMQNGLVWCGHELEPKFVKLGNENIDLWNGRYSQHFTNWGTAVLLQGDSRELANNIQGFMDLSLTSPPFGAGETRNRTKFADGEIASMMTRAYTQDKQGVTNGNLAHLQTLESDFEAAVSSPVYAETVKNGEGTGVRYDPKGHKGDNAYKATSQAAYGETNGQLGKMNGGGFEAAVSSSPFESVETCQDKKFRLNDGRKTPPQGQGGYGNSNGQLGQDSGETFWTAARQIVEQTYMVLKPGAYAAWVCGDFIKKGKRVYFGRQWLELCQAVGFEPIEWAIAWKTEYKGTQLDIFGGEHEKRIDRVSFFRRLANEKNPDNAILNEDVIFVRKPL